MTPRWIGDAELRLYSLGRQEKKPFDALKRGFSAVESVRWHPSSPGVFTIGVCNRVGRNPMPSEHANAALRQARDEEAFSRTGPQTMVRGRRRAAARTALRWLVWPRGPGRYLGSRFADAGQAGHLNAVSRRRRGHRRCAAGGRTGVDICPFANRQAEAVRQTRRERPHPTSPTFA
jgi:hypothetical protein